MKGGKIMSQEVKKMKLQKHILLITIFFCLCTKSYSQVSSLTSTAISMYEKNSYL